MERWGALMNADMRRFAVVLIVCCLNAVLCHESVAAPRARVSCREAALPVSDAARECTVIAQAGLGQRRASLVLTHAASLVDPSVPAKELLLVVDLVVEEPGQSGQSATRIYRVEQPASSHSGLFEDVHAVKTSAEGVLLISYPENWSGPNYWWLAWPSEDQTNVALRRWASYRMDRVVPHLQRTYYAGINGRRRVVLALKAAGEPEIVTGPIREAVLEQTPIERETYGAASGSPTPPPEIRHTREDERRLSVTATGGASCSVHSNYSALFGTEPATLTRTMDRKIESFGLRRFSSEEYRRLRREAGDPWLRTDSDYQLVTAIGPVQAEGNRIWFGRAFYDAEGLSGIGGFGYLDCEAGEFREFFPVQGVRYMAQSMLVEPEAVWLSMTSFGEYGNASAGLLRWDRRKGWATLRTDMPLAAHVLREGPHLVLLHSGGVSVLTGEHIRHFAVAENPDDSLVVVELDSF